MKSERRHKLQENALAHSLENLPKMGRESGSKLLLGIVTVLLVIVLIQYYLRSQREKKEMIATELVNARYDLADLNGDHDVQREMEVATKERTSAMLTADERKKLLDDIEKKVDAVLAETTDVPLVAQGKNILADAYVHVAMLGNPPEATTRPEMALPRPPEDLLDDASKAYQAVLEMKDVPFAEAADAHFGLGAIAENRQEWDKARTQYEAVQKYPDMPKFFTDTAALRIEVLDKISGPFVVGRPMTSPSDFGLPKTFPTTAPATGPATGPATETTTAPGAPATPATVPVAPSTGPATVPVSGIGLNDGYRLPTTAPTTGPTTRAK